ncbi:MAG: hypothetical protein M0T84_17095 [Betaproteobacteria bacterium]|nr:hypothetical protein [Betaproteobacteria bacterium]
MGTKSSVQAAKTKIETTAQKAVEEGKGLANSLENEVHKIVDETVGKWLGDVIHSIPHLRETDAYNRLRVKAHDLKEELKARLG